jgi:hypothetical protein
MKQGQKISTYDEAGWLLLLHQLPPRSGYSRVKIWRQLRAIGAIVLRNSAYVLPRSERGLMELRSIVQQIERCGGEAALCETRFISGIGDSALKELFNAALETEYRQLESALQKISAPRATRRSRQGDSAVKLEKLGQRLADLTARDFFGAKGRAKVLAKLAALEHSPILTTSSGNFRAKAGSLLGKVWVTRRDIHEDRIACAWLIRRFIDPQASFKFVQSKAYRPLANELRFDMKDAEFTHEGDMCSFEVLLKRTGQTDPALHAMAEIVHDLDLCDGKFGRPETVGIGHILNGICMTQHDDKARIDRSTPLLNDAYEEFRLAKRKPGKARSAPAQ